MSEQFETQREKDQYEELVRAREMIEQLTYALLPYEIKRRELAPTIANLKAEITTLRDAKDFQDKRTQAIELVKQLCCLLDIPIYEEDD